MLSEGSGKARQAAELSQSVKAVRAPGEQLMNIALMADVKNEPVFFCVEHTLNCERQLHNAKIRRQMPAGLADMTNQKIPDLPAELRLLCVGPVPEDPLWCEFSLKSYVPLCEGQSPSRFP